ncbi:hypothetical protein RRG08_051535 [Elysia crispata]|uniref:Uncharacterized protein n=1 Tax=Elysia crispata TaxID=231223 RepID=A0AAE1CU80_9GAST|nr:hypothetical protein RRG08_051535 [Elysia crispata]
MILAHLATNSLHMRKQACCVSSPEEAVKCIDSLGDSNTHSEAQDATRQHGFHSFTKQPAEVVICLGRHQ